MFTFTNLVCYKSCGCGKVLGCIIISRRFLIITEKREFMANQDSCVPESQPTSLFFLPHLCVDSDVAIFRSYYMKNSIIYTRLYHSNWVGFNYSMSKQWAPPFSLPPHKIDGWANQIAGTDCRYSNCRVLHTKLMSHCQGSVALNSVAMDQSDCSPHKIDESLNANCLQDCIYTKLF